MGIQTQTSASSLDQLVSGRFNQAAKTSVLNPSTKQAHLESSLGQRL